MDKYNSNFARFQADIFRDKPRSPKPIFEIKKIDQPYLVIFYTLAWGINPNLLGMGRAKAGYQRMITDLSRRFREAANKAEIIISSRVSLFKTYDFIWRYGEYSVSGYWLAKTFYYLYLNVPLQYHALYIPIVKETIRQFTKGHEDTAAKLINGASLGGML